MQPFEKITFSYKNNEYTVEPENVWGLIGAIENVISRLKLAIKLHTQDVPETKIAEAYCAALVFAGCKKITPREVLAGCDFREVMEMANQLFLIMSLASPPPDEKIAEHDGGQSGKVQAVTKTKGSSKPPSKRG